MRAHGFILVAVLWVLAGLAALATYIDGMVATDVERARLVQNSIDNELHRRSTEATLLYLLSTGRMSYRGLVLEEKQRFIRSFDDPSPPPGDGELTLAGEPYAGLGGLRFSLQDERGLAPLNIPNSPVLAAVLEQAGVRPADIALIAPRMHDYTDMDHQLSLNGAERFDYEQQGLPPPSNWFMAGPAELRNVLGVDSLISASQWRATIPLLSTRGWGVYNFNTMQPQVLAAVLGLDLSGVRPVLAARKKHPITRLSQIAMLTGKYPSIDEERMAMIPSPYVRIAVWSADSARRWVTGISLTPGGAAPWRTEYRYSEQYPHSEWTRNHVSETVQQAATPLL